MTLIKLLLGIDPIEDAEEYNFHRTEMRKALDRQHEASEKAESTLVDMLTRAAAQKSQTRRDLKVLMAAKKKN